jgi:ABC-2 type transport system ATP-binding protein/lipopolysaccharide transport system ATP-binding protein
MIDSIVLEHVFKRFRRYPTRSYTTFKDALVKGNLFHLHRPRQFVEALKDISFSVPKGTVLGIIGPNGAGKSTLLKLLAGIYRPTTSRRITIRGRVSALLNLGVGLHPELTGRENIVINGLAMGLSHRKVQKKFDEIVQFAELEEFIDAPVRTYSSGMFMRLAFSVAVNVDPDILLLDEILSVGDSSFAEKSRARIEEFKKEEKTILFVSHDLQAVENWCHNVLWLEHGSVRQCGEVAKVVRAYRSCYHVSGEATKA